MLAPENVPVRAPHGPRGFAGLAPEAVRRLGAGEALVFDGVLGQATARALAAALTVPDERLAPAAVGRDAGRRVVPVVRGDCTRWLERSAGEPLASLWQLFDRVAAELGERAWLGVAGADVQLACYPVGARYARHRDTFAGHSGDSRGSPRRATATYYLNHGWSPGDGGELRVHAPGGACDLAPLLDRLVLFLAGVEHEVLPARVPRWAVSAFLLGPAP